MHKDSADFGAVKTIKEEDMYDETDLDSPSNAIKLGFDLKRLINIKIGMCIEQGHLKERQEAEDVLTLMNIFWGSRVTKLARVLLEERRFNKVQSLPDTEDLKKLNMYLKVQSLPDTEDLKKLNMYLRERSTTFEKHLLKSQEVMEIRGKVI